MRGGGIETLTNTINKMFKNGASTGDIGKMLGLSKVNKDAIQTAVSLSDVADSVDDVMDVAKSTGSGLKSAGKGLFDNIKSFVTNPAVLATAGVVAAYAITDKMTTSRSEAVSNAQEKINKAQGSQAEVDSIKSELAGIDQQINAINANPLTIASEAEKGKLEAQKEELTAILALKEATAKIDAKDASNAAKDALTTKGITNTSGTKSWDFVESDWFANLTKLSSIVNSDFGDMDKLTEVVSMDLGEQMDFELKQLEDWQKERADILADTTADEAQKAANDKRNDELERIIDDQKKKISDERAVMAELYKAMNPDDEMVKNWNDIINPKIDEALGVTEFEKKTKGLEKALQDSKIAQAQQDIVDRLRKGEDLSIKDLESDYNGLGDACLNAGTDMQFLLDNAKELATMDGGTTALEDKAIRTAEAIKSLLDSATARQDAINGAMASANSGKGIGYDQALMLHESFKGTEGMGNFDTKASEALFQKTANGITLNRNALRALQSQQESLTKAGFTKAIDEQNTKIAEQTRLYEDATGMDKEQFRLQIATAKEDLHKLQLAESQYIGLTSAYAKWIDISSSADTGAMYKGVSSSIDSIKELYDKAEIGGETFRAGVQMFTNQDLSKMGKHDVAKLWETEGRANAERYFTGDQKGVDNFLADAVKTGIMTLSDGVYDLQEGMDKELASKLGKNGMSVEALHQLLDAANLYGTDFNIGDDLSENASERLKMLQTDAENAKEKLKSTFGEEYDFNFKANSMDSLNGQIDRANELVQGLAKNEDGSINMSADGAEEAVLALTTLIQRREEIASDSIIMKVDAEDNEALNTLQQFQEAKDKFDTESQLANTGVGNAEALSKAKAEAEALLPALAKISEEHNIPIDCSSIEAAEKDIQGLSEQEQIELMAALNIDQSAIDAATGEEVEILGTVRIDETQLQAMVTALGGEKVEIPAEVDVQEPEIKIPEMPPVKVPVEMEEVNFQKIAENPKPLKVKVDQEEGKTLTQKQSEKRTITVDEVQGTVIEPKPDETRTITVDEVQGDTVAPVKAEGGTATVKYNKDSSAVDGYKAPDKTAKAKYTVDAGAVNSWKAPDKAAKVNYSLGSTPSYNPQDINRTITYTIKTVGSIPSGVGGANGSAHHRGTVPSFKGSSYAMGSCGNAHAGGNWGIPRNETALVNELGNEIRVRDGQWELLQGGARFEPLKKGDILFNHVQSEQLLKNGYVTANGGRGTAYAQGTVSGNAYSSGGGALWKPSYSSTTSTKSSNTSTKAQQQATKAAENTAKATTKAATSTKKAMDEIRDYFDLVQIRMDRFARDSKRAEDAIKRAIGLSDTQAKTATTITKVQAEMSVASQSAERILRHAEYYAKKYGLAGNIKNAIQSGANVFVHLDDTQKKLAGEYKNLYDDYLKALDLVDELADRERELAISRLDNIEEFYDATVKLNDAIIDVNSAKLELNEAIGSSAVSSDVKSLLQSSIKQQENTQKQALQKLTDYQAEFNSLVKNGYLKQGSVDWYEYQEVMKKLEAEVSNVSVALIELQDELRKVDYTKLQHAIDSFDRGAERLKNTTDLKDARDQKVTRSDYQAQINEVSKSADSNYKLRAAKLKEQNLYAISSERYQQLAKEIADLDGQIYDSLISIEDLRDKVFEAELAPFVKHMEDRDYMLGELAHVRKLLDSDSFITKTGALTDNALADLALISRQIGSERQNIADYTAGIQKLDGMLKSGLISTVEYEQKQREFLDAIRSSSEAVDDYRDSIIDLYKSQMTEENKYLKKSIDVRKEALSAKKEYYDYDKRIRNESKDVNAIKSQIAALEGVGNASAQAQLKRLKDQLATAEETLADTKYQHEYSMTQKGYDSMKDSASKFLEDTLYEITMNASKQEEIISNMLDNVVNNYKEAYSVINEIVSSSGFQGTNLGNFYLDEFGTERGMAGSASMVTRDQDKVVPVTTVGNINTSNTTTAGVNTGNIASQISKAPETNRKVAELTISQTSVSLEMGKSTSVTTSIRPTDASNKTLKWTSSNTSVATVSNGTIRGITPGSTTVVVATTDGGNLTRSISVTITAKPKPVTTTTKAPAETLTPASGSSNGGGDGVARVGDRVTFSSGRYYNTPQGTGASGARNMGSQVYITRIMSGSHGYHISTGNKLGNGDLGWLKLSQIKGYASGTRKAKKGLARFDDTKSGSLDLGSEVLMTKHGVLKQMDGDTIFSKAQTDNLWKISHLDPVSSSDRLGKGQLYNMNKHETVQSINLSFDSLLTVQGNADAGFMDEARKHMPKLANEMGRMLMKELGKM